MRTIPITKFRGMAEDYRFGDIDEFSFARHFDTLTYPHRLQPLRGMSSDTSVDNGIGNIIVGSDGRMYGVGWQASAHADSALYQRCDGTIGSGGYGAGDTWKALSNGLSSGDPWPTRPFLVEHKDIGDAKTMLYADQSYIVRVDPSNVASDDGIALPTGLTTIGQGFVHPKDKILYYPYQSTTGGTSASKIAKITESGGTGATTDVFTVSSNTSPNAVYRAYGLSNYGNYLAVPLTASGGNGQYNSYVGLWDRDTSNTLFTETIPWGGGNLKVLNNLGGILIGVSTRSTGVSGSIQDSDGIEIKVYAGGTDPILIHTISQNTLNTGNVTMSINENVNFVKNNRLYFSIGIAPNDGSIGRYGLWSVGKVNGRWSVVCERTANNTDSGLGVLAAAIQGDFVSLVYSSVGTTYATTNGITSDITYGATSIYESCVNPGQTEEEKTSDKKLLAFYVNCLHLQTGQSIVMKYKVDDTLIGVNWTTVATISAMGGSGLIMTDAAGVPFTDGTFYEFYLSSTGGAVITDWGYKIKVKPQQ